MEILLYVEIINNLTPNLNTMKYILVILAKILMTIIWLSGTLILLTVGQVFYTLWTLKLKWVSNLVELYKVDCNVKWEEHKPNLVYKTVFHWLFNGRYHDFN